MLMMTETNPPPARVDTTPTASREADVAHAASEAVSRCRVLIADYLHCVRGPVSRVRVPGSAGYACSCSGWSWPGPWQLPSARQDAERARRARPGTHGGCASWHARRVRVLARTAGARPGTHGGCASWHARRVRVLARTAGVR